MHLLRWTFAVLASTVVLNTSPLNAQSKSVQPYFTLSTGIANSVREAEFQQIIAEGLVGLKLLPRTPVGIVVAAFGGRAFDPPVFGSDLPCPIEPGGGCRPMLNGFSLYGIQLGGQLRYKNLSLEASSGPGTMHFNRRSNSSGRPRPATNTSSVHTRVEGAIIFGNHIGMVVTGSWRHVKEYDGAPLSANSFGFGLRIQ